MRKVLALTLGVLLVAGAAFAQEPAEVPLFFAVGIPSNALPTIDGDNSDWAWVDRSFEVTIEDMNPLTGGADDADDLFIDLIIGWSDSNNRIHAMVHVHDDFLIVDRTPPAPSAMTTAKCISTPTTKVAARTRHPMTKTCSRPTRCA